MNKDFLGIEKVDLGTLKSAFLTPDRENVLYTETLTKKEIATYLYEISKLNKQEKYELIIKKLNDIYQGNIEDEEELNKQESYLVLLLKSIPFDKKEADTYWKNRAESGIHKDTKKVLIEVAAIHPLIDGKPGKEFKEHLDKAIELYNFEKEKGNNPIIYVPGSLHYIINRETKIPQIDSQPLSEAGKKYLILQGIPEEEIRANIVNVSIKQKDGVYNSGDECYVATQIAKNENCGRIISVVSPVQLYRKALFYQEFGYIPELYATGTEKTNHNYIGELFWSLYITYMNDPDWQTSFLSYLTRKERDIDYMEKIQDYKEIIEEILKNGPGIPDGVFEQKKEWLNLYENAKKNMEDINNKKSGVLINLIRTEGKQQFEQKRLLEIIEQNPNSEITIIFDPTTNIEDIMNIMEQKSNNFKLIPSQKRDPYIISELFKKGDYKKLFHMCPSSTCMKEAVGFIKQGIIPIVSTLPETNPNYIENISNLFDEAMKPIRNNPEESKEPEI